MSLSTGPVDTWTTMPRLNMFKCAAGGHLSNGKTRRDEVCYAPVFL